MLVLLMWSFHLAARDWPGLPPQTCKHKDKDTAPRRKISVVRKNSHLEIREALQHARPQPTHTARHPPRRSHSNTAAMHLMYIADPADPSKRIYTLQKVIDGKVSKSAHPARFSPDDKYSRHRVTIKKRYGLLLTQQSKLNSGRREGRLCGGGEGCTARAIRAANL